MHPNKKDIIYTSFPKSPLLNINRFYVQMNDISTEYLTEIARAEMGGSKGIHKIENYGQKR